MDGKGDVTTRMYGTTWFFNSETQHHEEEELGDREMPILLIESVCLCCVHKESVLAFALAR